MSRHQQAEIAVPAAGRLLALVVALQLLGVGRTRGESRVDYRYEDYQEEGDRILILGIAHDFDEVDPKSFLKPKHKDTTDAIIGISQILDPQTVFSVNLTIGGSSGYLNDPYKFVRFNDYPDDGTGVFREKRPREKTKEILLLTLTHHFDRVNGTAEASYRFYHDSYDIFSHTVSLAWYQKIGKHLILKPSFRYYDQTAADFYHIRLPGDPSDPDNPTPIPEFYSADYRLASLHTFTYGLNAIVIVKDWLHLDFGYKRYEMIGDDNTPSSAFPKANVFDAGVTIWF